MSLPGQGLGTRQETNSSVTTGEKTPPGSERREEQVLVDVHVTNTMTDSQPMSLPGQGLGTRLETNSSVTTREKTPPGSERREEQVLVDVYVSNTRTDSQHTFLPDQDLGTREEESSIIIETTGKATLTGSEGREEQAPIHIPNSFTGEVTRLETTSTLSTGKASLSGRDGKPQEPRGMLNMLSDHETNVYPYYKPIRDSY